MTVQLGTTLASHLRLVRGVGPSWLVLAPPGGAAALAARVARKARARSARLPPTHAMVLN